MKQKLPIDDLLPDIRKALASSMSLILQASPGSGKTTRVPPHLLDEPWAAGKEIWVLVPRRLAAKMAALRVAEECNEDVGESVGYHFRFERAVGPKTRLKFLTEGMFLRLALADPQLKTVAAVVVDEFHERHLQTDVALACLKRLQSKERPDLKIVVMSATLEAEELSHYLGDAPILRLETKRYPVDIAYFPLPANKRLEMGVREAVGAALAKASGDILVFLPGVGEILRCDEALRSAFRNELKILPLYADLSREAQAEVFRPASQPKVILATNVAETSLTIDGVTTVIDTGLHRRASFSWWSGLSRLVTRPIAKASAIQRAGRAGRTAPGQCFRLYSQSDFEGRPGFEVPEIQRSDLSPTLLEVLGLGGEIGSFPWFLTPPSDASAAAEILLERLGAVQGGSLTTLGREMAGYSLHPRLARAVIEAAKRGVLEETATLAAWISEGDFNELNLFDILEIRRPPNVQRLREQILGGGGKKNGAKLSSETEAARSLLAGFPDRVAKKRAGTKGAEVELVFATGGSALVARQPVIEKNEYFLVLDVQERGRQGEGKLKVHVHTLIPIKADWLLDLGNDLIREEEALIWDAERGKVYEVARLSYGELILSEDRGEPRDAEAASRLLLREAFGIDAGNLPSVPDLLKLLERHLDPEPVESFLSRLKLLKKDEADSGFIFRALSGVTSLNDLHPAALQERLENALGPALRGELDRALPTHHQLGARRVKIHYQWDQNPWIASRLQDFFGLKQGPTILGGRLALTLQLLAPNQRPVQVTQDLASFWKNIYSEVRKELSRKYPRHKWPENPNG